VPGPEAGSAGGHPAGDLRGDPAAAVAALRSAGLTIAVAESLTAGQVSARLADVPGASAVLRGGVVSYATEVKASVLGVDAALLAASGPVHPEVARQMARGVRALLGADVGVATTGVAGPGPQDGHPAGTAFVALTWGDATKDRSHPLPEVELVEQVLALSLSGDRAQVRAATTAAALGLVVDVVQARRAGGGAGVSDVTPPGASPAAGEERAGQDRR